MHDHVLRPGVGPLRSARSLPGEYPVGDARPRSAPPGSHGGNLDINPLTRGCSLYLPAQAEGALVGPLAETSDYPVPTGLDEDLDETVTACVRPRSRCCRPVRQRMPRTPTRTSTQQPTSTSRRSWIS